MCYPVCGMVHIKDPSRYVNGPLTYVQCHITIKYVLSASLNKTFPSFLPFLAISRSSQCSTTGVTIKKVAYVAVAGFLSRYLYGPLTYL